MSRQNILCRDRVGQGEENLCRDRVFFVLRQSLALDEVFMSQ